MTEGFASIYEYMGYIAIVCLVHFTFSFQELLEALATSKTGRRFPMGSTRQFADIVSAICSTLYLYRYYAIYTAGLTSSMTEEEKVS